MLRCYKPDRRWSSRCQVGAERRAAARTHDGEKREERQRRIERGGGIYACIAMHHPSFVRETKGHHRVRCLSCFAHRHLKVPQDFVRARA